MSTLDHTRTTHNADGTKTYTEVYQGTTFEFTFKNQKDLEIFTNPTNLGAWHEQRNRHLREREERSAAAGASDD